ncbi:MAG: hypothetical protein HDR21_07420 [Lachnospiraceae bacterium]|nr:hypothetical protein [Lachnospiraceae bacterium]MBD5481434.1 hypothetical protein [Lachnospiraceae bacterium]
MRKAETICDLSKKDDVVSDMKTKYGDKRVALVRSKNFSESKTYTEWANKVVENIFGKDRATLNSGECNFSYIKFAKNKKEEIFAIVAGVSQFHKKYTSDICFYDIQTEKKDAAEFMRKNELSWDEYEILIFLNQNNDFGDRKEALKNEKKMQCDYILFG